MIRLINLRNERPKGATYIGRGNPLGNPAVIGRDGTRAQVIEIYRGWIIDQIAHRKTYGAKVWEALQTLSRRYKAGEEIILACFCVPEDCHGFVVKEIVEILAERLP